MKQLKIAFITGQFPVVSETFIINQIGFLKEKGHLIDILCLGKKHIEFEPNEIINTFNLLDSTILFTWRALMPLNKFKRLLKVLTVIKQSYKHKLFFKMMGTLNPFYYGFNAINFSQFFKTYHLYYFKLHNYDVVHIHFADHAVQLYEQLVNYCGKITVTFHGYDTHNFDSEFYKQLQTLKRIKYTVNTNFTKSKVLALGFTESQITVLPMGLDTTFFKPEKIAHNVFNILFVGRLIELKAPMLAILIIESLIKQSILNIHLNIIGSGSEYDRCNNYIKSNNLGTFVTLHHNKSQKEVKYFMNTSDVFLFPGIVDDSGRCETFGLVLQEAHAMELPVIISDVGGMQEGIIPNITGFVVKENDIDGFVDCLKLLINNPTKRDEMGKAGRAFTIKNYDNKILGQQLLKLYLT